MLATIYARVMLDGVTASLRIYGLYHIVFPKGLIKDPLGLCLRFKFQSSVGYFDLH